MANFADRMIRAAKLDVQLYEEVEADKEALGQSMGVVVLSSVAGGIGSFQVMGMTGIVVGTVASLIGWYIWAYLTYLIGTKMLPEPETQSDIVELLRTTGFSSSPGILRILGVVPVLAIPVGLISSIWMLASMIIAVRQALDYKSTWRAVGVCLIGWIIQTVIVVSIVLLAGGPKQPA